MQAMIDYRGKVLQCAPLINAKQSQALQNGLSASCHNYTQRTQTDASAGLCKCVAAATAANAAVVTTK